MRIKKEPTIREASSGERTFETYWIMFGNPAYAYVREYVFSKRKWTFDFAFVQWALAVEIEGGVFSGGRHVRGKGYSNDIEKYNEAVLLGWRLLRFTPQQLEAAPDTCIAKVITLIERAS